MSPEGIYLLILYIIICLVGLGFCIGFLTDILKISSSELSWTTSKHIQESIAKKEKYFLKLYLNFKETMLCQQEQ